MLEAHFSVFGVLLNDLVLLPFEGFFIFDQFLNLDVLVFSEEMLLAVTYAALWSLFVVAAVT